MSDTSPTPPAAPPEAAPPAPPVTPAPVASVLSEAAAPEQPAEPAKVEAPKALELVLPKGFEADEKTVEGFKALAGELGLDGAKASKVVESFAAFEKARNEQLDSLAQAQDAKWRAELEALPEFSGEAKAAAMGDVRRALTKFGGQGFAKLLHAAGLGNHPELLKGFAAIGRALREDSVAGSTRPPGAAPERQPDHVVLYGPATSPSKEQ